VRKHKKICAIRNVQYQNSVDPIGATFNLVMCLLRH
jgi:hypothetical protein